LVIRRLNGKDRRRSCGLKAKLGVLILNQNGEDGIK
jgi:hypothetical protein